jgi:hypothetical protein
MLKPLPIEFLKKIARDYALTSPQEEAFVAHYSVDDEVRDDDLAANLHISSGAFRTRMTGVYKKFSIAGEASGKFYKLRVFLSDLFGNHGTVIEESAPDIDSLVQQVRSQIEPVIRAMCGTMRVLDMEKGMDLDSIYINVKVKPLKSDKKRIDGKILVEETETLMIFGGLGAGKTIFLKRLAILCNQGELLKTHIPIFISLKEWAEVAEKIEFLDFVGELFSQPINTLRTLLKAGRGLILLDGLDQVPKKDHNQILSGIKKITTLNRENHIVITSRTSAQISRRKDVFQAFTEVEIPTFSSSQIQKFANKWFLARKPECVDENGKSIAGGWFLEELNDRKNIKDLVKNPLLLTSSCLDFEQLASFPKRHTEIYERFLQILLSQWNNEWGIEGDSVHGNLSVELKKQLLGHLAFVTFEKGIYFQNYVAKQEIRIYTQNLPNSRSIDSGEFLQGIIVENGLLKECSGLNYSFSHTTFHEYFVARNIVDQSSSAKYEIALSQLMNNIGKKRWSEIFLLVVENSNNVDWLLALMKKEVDSILGSDEYLQRFLTWVSKKGTIRRPASFGTSQKSFSIRLYYYILALSFDTTRKVEVLLNGNIDINRAIDLSKTLIRSLLKHKVSHQNVAIFNDSEIDIKVQEMLDQLLYFNNEEEPQKWWNKNSESWKKKFYNLIIKYPNIKIEWKFNISQRNKLQKYYDANLLLVQCLNSDCTVSRHVRESIEETLLLPMEEC